MTVPQQFKTEDITKTEIIAMKAVYDGEGTPHQQRLALFAIVNKLCRAQDALYIPGSFDATAFLNGRAFVGHEILKYLKIPVGKLDDIPE